jgi:hypothetical protein
VLGDYDHPVIDTPPNLGLLTVNALVCADRVLAPVSVEDEASLHGIFELKHTIAKLAERLGVEAPELAVVLTRWQRHRISSRETEVALVAAQLVPIEADPVPVGVDRAGGGGQSTAVPERARQLAGHRVRVPGGDDRGGERTMSPAPRRALTIDDPIGSGEACHVARLAATGQPDGRLRAIPVDEIKPNLDQPRKHFDEEALGSLADSIRERGVLQPIISRPGDTGGYELVAGERRWRAARLAGQPTIPALVDPDHHRRRLLATRAAQQGWSIRALEAEIAPPQNLRRKPPTPLQGARSLGRGWPRGAKGGVRIDDPKRLFCIRAAQS